MWMLKHNLKQYANLNGRWICRELQTKGSKHTIVGLDDTNQTKWKERLK